MASIDDETLRRWADGFVPEDLYEDDLIQEALARGGQLAAMREAIELTLMWFRSGPWTDQDDAWKKITGTSEATSKVLCDHLRKVLAHV